jgi:hypothetical protein
MAKERSAHRGSEVWELRTRREVLRGLGVGAVGLAGAAILGCTSVEKPTSAAAAKTSTAAANASPQATAVAPRLAVPDSSIAVRGELIAPKDTDPAIDVALEPHYVAFSPTVPARGLLFLFMAGTTNLPEEHRLITDQAARNGFHAVNLRYPNADAVQTLCATDADTACFEKARLEVIDGTKRSPKVNVNRANSIEDRLLKLLAYLETKHPGEGWAAYIDGTAPKWASIVVSGHSQGGGDAALIARDHVVERVAMLSAPVDHLGLGLQVGASQPAPWLLGPHATPTERYYAFCHLKDETCNWELQWKAMTPSLDLGSIVNPSEGTPPYGNAHALLTDASPEASPGRPATKLLTGGLVQPNHGSTARDDVTPKTPAGRPLFAPVWQYACFA